MFTYRTVIMGLIGGLVLFMMATTAAPFFYHKDTFTATVTEIEYHSRGGIFGGSDVTLRFDDGRVFNLYKVPSELRLGQTYTLEYRTPHLLGSPYMAIAEPEDN